MSKFAGESANFFKNVRPIRNLSIIWRKRLLKYPPACGKQVFMPPPFWLGRFLEWNRPFFILCPPVHIEEY